MSGAAKVARGVGKTIKWFLIGVVLLIVVIAIVAIVSLGKSANKSESSSKNVAAHLSEVQMGMSKAQVEGILGKPENAQQFQSTFAGTTDTSACIYYGSLASTSYQFCFDNGVLTSKNQY